MPHDITKKTFSTNLNRTGLSKRLVDQYLVGFFYFRGNLD